MGFNPIKSITSGVKKLPWAQHPALGGKLPGSKQPSGPNFGGTKTPMFAMKNTSQFMKDDPSIKIGGDQGGSAIQRRYAGLRDRASQDANANMDVASNALKRKFTSIGAAGSGSAIKMQQQLLDQGARQKADAIRDIDTQEQAELSNRELAQADMDFKQRVFNFDKGSKLHELDLAERQQQIDSTSTEFNKRLAEFQARPPKHGLLTSVLGDLILRSIYGR
jgi:hypothetical protein